MTAFISSLRNMVYLGQMTAFEIMTLRSTIYPVMSKNAGVNSFFVS